MAYKKYKVVVALPLPNRKSNYKVIAEKLNVEEYKVRDILQGYIAKYPKSLRKKIREENQDIEKQQRFYGNKIYITEASSAKAAGHIAMQNTGTHKSPSKILTIEEILN